MIFASDHRSSECSFGMVVMCALQGESASRVRVPAGQLSFQPEALGAFQEVTNGLKHSEKSLSWRGSVSRGPQRVANTEQAPKVPTWESTRHNNEEDRRPRGRERLEHPRVPPG
jgi:hypothetical protein